MRFGGVDSLYCTDHSINTLVTFQVVKKFLKSSWTYTLHLIQPKKFTRQKIHTPRPRVIFSCDLAEVSMLQKFIDNYVFILVCINVFLHFLQVILLKRKNGACVAFAFRYMLEREESRCVSHRFTDKETEFYNKNVRDYLNSKN